MALQIGQIRSNEVQESQDADKFSFIKVAEGTISQSKIPAGDGSISVLEDTLVNLSSSFTIENKYFVVLNIQKLNTPQNIKAYLYSSTDSGVSKQYIETYKIPAGSGDTAIVEYVRIQMVLAPNRNYNSILLELQRTDEYDYSKMAEEEYRRTVTLTGDIKIYTITNLLNEQDFLSGKTLKQIGVQAPAGLLMCINGEGIRVGPSGLYEIKEEYRFNFLGFVAGQTPTGIDGRNVFILDYLYE